VTTRGVKLVTNTPRAPCAVGVFGRCCVALIGVGLKLMENFPSNGRLGMTNNITICKTDVVRIFSLSASGQRVLSGLVSIRLDLESSRIQGL